LGNRRLLSRKKAAAANPTAEVSDFFLGGASVTPNGQLPSVRLPQQNKATLQKHTVLKTSCSSLK